MSAALEIVPRTVAAARARADRLRATAEDFAGQLLQAYQLEDWKTLGYGSWREYATTELDVSQSRAYQLLDQAKVVAAIQEAAGVSNTLEITARDTAALKPALPEVTAEIKVRVDGGEEPTEVVRALVEQKREERKLTLVKSAPDEEESADDAEYGAAPEFDVHAELAVALEENQRLHEALDATDQGAELRKWMDKYTRLDGRVQQMLATDVQQKKQLKYYTGLLKKTAGLLGVDDFGSVPKRVMEIVQGGAA